MRYYNFSSRFKLLKWAFLCCTLVKNSFRIEAYSLHVHKKCVSSSTKSCLHKTQYRSSGCIFLNFPVSISRGRTPILNCAKIDLFLRDLHSLTYGSGDKSFLNNSYVRNLGLSDKPRSHRSVKFSIHLFSNTLTLHWSIIIIINPTHLSGVKKSFHFTRPIIST